MTQHIAKSKRNGFLLFIVGCILAVSGAAKLNESERVIRIRQMGQNVAQKKIKSTLRAMVKHPGQVPSLQTILVRYAAQKSTSVKQKLALRKAFRTQLQNSYAQWVALSAQKLSIRQPEAQFALLQTKLLKAISEQIIPSLKIKAQPKKKKRVVRKALTRSLVTGMIHSLMNKKPAPVKERALPKVVVSAIELLTEQAARHLIPYVMWEALVHATQQHIALVVLKKAQSRETAVVRALQKKLSTEAARTLLNEHLRTTVRSTGKALRLRSSHFAFVADSKKMNAFVKGATAPLHYEQAVALLDAIHQVWSRAIAKTFAPFAARTAAKRLKFVFSAPLLLTGGGKALNAKKPTSRPTSQPVRAQPKRERIAFLKSNKRIGGWPSSLPFFIMGALVACFGLFVWRKAVTQEVQARLADQDDDEMNPFSLLEQVQEPLETLQNDIDTLSEEEVCERVDQVLGDYILPFAEVRRNVIEQLGMESGAEILVTVAFGERMLNRVWSAASDGHLPEARSVLPDAVSAFKEAHTQSQTALSTVRSELSTEASSN